MKKLLNIFFILLHTLVFSQTRYSTHNVRFGSEMPELKEADVFFYSEWEANPADFPNKLSDIVNLQKLNKKANVKYLINKEKESTVVEILINGQKFSESHYKNGLLDGFKTIYREKGLIFQQIEFKNGKANGIAKVYNERGNLILETNYKNNLKDGLRRFIIPRRKDITIEGNYTEGNIKGDLKVSCENEVYFYPNDLKKGLVKRFVDDKLVSEFSISQEKVFNGEFKEYNPITGKLMRKTPYYLGDINGFVEYYKLNGEFHFKNEYRFGNRVGAHKYYGEDNTLFSEEYYDQEGLKTGVWKDYERSGVLSDEKQYVNDKLEGTAKEFRNGILTESIEYHEGKRNGISKYFEQKTGVLKTEALYEDDIRKNEKQYYPEGMVFKETDFRKDGRRIAVRYYDKEKKLLCENKWGENGNPKGTHKTYNTSRDNKLYLDTEIEYNEKGEQVINANYNADGGYVIKHLKDGKWHGLTTVYSSKTNTKEEIYYFQSKKVTKEEFEKLNK